MSFVPKVILAAMIVFAPVAACTNGATPNCTGDAGCNEGTDATPPTDSGTGGGDTGSVQDTGAADTGSGADTGGAQDSGGRKGDSGSMDSSAGGDSGKGGKDAKPG